MNTAIDQQCEKTIKELGLEKDLEKIRREKYKDQKSPLYNNTSSPDSLPKGNDGLGLKLLGLSGDEVLPKEISIQ